MVLPANGTLSQAEFWFGIVVALLIVLIFAWAAVHFTHER
jgi:hypothetical protein